MSDRKKTSTSKGVPLLPALLACLFASICSCFFMTHYKNRAQSTQFVPTPKENLDGAQVVISGKLSDEEYLSLVMAEERGLQERYQIHKQRFDQPAPSERARLGYLTDQEDRLYEAVEEIGDQVGLAESIREQIEARELGMH